MKSKQKLSEKRKRKLAEEKMKIKKEARKERDVWRNYEINGEDKGKEEYWVWEWKLVFVGEEILKWTDRKI